jgi:hypothetical protein
MAARCPSDLALERHLLEPQASPLRSHLAGCASCQARLEEMGRQAETFHRQVYPATVAAVEGAVAARHRQRLRWLVLGPALAAAVAAVLFLVRPVGSPSHDDGATGGLGITVLVEEGAGVRPVRSGEVVGAAAALRFRVQAASACRLWILSLDATGEFTRLYPGEGTGGAAVSGAAEIPVGAVLDGQAGPARIVAICTPGPAKWRALAAQLKGGAAAGEAFVRARPNAAALPAGAQLASVLLEKRT